MIERELSPSTINVRLTAVRKLIGEAKRNGILGAEQAAQLADVPNVRQQGTRLGNWLTREQAKELLAVPNRDTLKGKRAAAILALLVGCALRRAELATLTIEDIQQREGRWMIADLRDKGGRIRTVAIPMWVKILIDTLTAAAGHSVGWLLRPVSKGGRVVGGELSDWAVWSVVVQSARAQDETAMPRSTTSPIGVPTGYPELVSERKTRLRPAQLRAAFAAEGFGPRTLRSMRSLAEAWPEFEILQRLTAKLPWGHTSRVMARVKGQPTRDWHLRASLEHGWSQIVLAGRIAARQEADSGANS
jgi:integrase